MVSGYTTQKNSEKNTIDASEQYVGQQKQTWDRLYSQLCANKCEQQKKKKKRKGGKRKQEGSWEAKAQSEIKRRQTSQQHAHTETHTERERARDGWKMTKQKQTRAAEYVMPRVTLIKRECSSKTNKKGWKLGTNVMERRRETAEGVKFGRQGSEGGGVGKKKKRRPNNQRKKQQ